MQCATIYPKASSIHLEGEVVHREHGGIAVRRGGSIFEAQAADIIEVKELEKNRVVVLINGNGQLIRSTVINSRTAWCQHPMAACI